MASGNVSSSSGSPGPSALSTSATANAEVEVSDAGLLVQLAGPRSDHLRILDREMGISSAIRGNRILLQGPAADVALAQRLIAELVSSFTTMPAMLP